MADPATLKHNDDQRRNVGNSGDLGRSPVMGIFASESDRAWKRREHYVPRFYLDLFGEPLFVFDKETGSVFSTTSKNIAFEEGFYDLDPLIDLEGQITENENLMRDGLNELLDKMNPATISLTSRIRVSLFIALQFVRTKEFRASIKETGGKMMTELVKSNPEFKNLDFRVVMKDQLAQALQAKVIVSDAVPQFGYILGNSLWTLLVNRTKVPFWTSDNPVSLFNPINYPDMSGTGLIFEAEAGGLRSRKLEYSCVASGSEVEI
jgi:hypothetical protein